MIDVAASAASLRESALAWARGKSPWARAALLAYLGWAGVRHLADDLYRSWFSGLTLVLHEMGHVAFAPFGHTLHVAGGSIAQLAAPIAATAHLLFWQSDFFGAAVGGAWLSFASFELATYVADANKERLPLVSFGVGDPKHDFATLLTEWHVLNACETIAAAIRVVATLVLAVSLAGGARLVFEMWRSGRRDEFGAP